jgi:hypothetical protein
MCFDSTHRDDVADVHRYKCETLLALDKSEVLFGFLVILRQLLLELFYKHGLQKNSESSTELTSSAL